MADISNDNKPNLRKVVVGPCIISYPQLFVAKQVLGQGEPFYGASFLFDPKTQQKELNKLAAAATAAADEAWPNGEWKAKKALRDGNVFWWPIRNGDEKAERKGYAGMIFISARSKLKPGVVDQNVQPILVQELIYPGCRVNASVVFFGYKQPRWGVGCALNNVQLVGDGERLGGKPDPSEDFDAVAYGNDNVPGNEQSWLS